MSLALLQGGLGMILSALIITAPPMAGAFFNGVLGSYFGGNNFSAEAFKPQHGAGGGGNAGSYPPGSAQSYANAPMREAPRDTHAGRGRAPSNN